MKQKTRVIRIIALLLVVSVVGLLVAGCGGKSQQGQPQPQQQQQQGEQQKKQVKVGAMFSIPDPARAGGWDRVQFAGLDLLRKDYGWEVSIAESVPYPKMSEVATGYADKGYDIVIFPDNGEIEAWKEVAPKYPDKWFIMMSVADTLPDAPKVAAWSPDMFAYGYIVGVVAAKASKTGVIGVVGGVPIPALIEQFSGVIEGAKAVRPDAKVLVYWAGDWMDSAKHREITMLQLKQGADVIYSVTGPAVKGVYEAAESQKAFSIGYASDWYNDAPNTILTSVMFDAAKMYKEMADQYLNGTLEKKITTVGPTYIQLADFHGKIPADVEKDIRDTVAKIQSGEIKIEKKIHEEIEQK
ncbi:BMP family protein [Moorellaceae bacterium AZ2]